MRRLRFPVVLVLGAGLLLIAVGANLIKLPFPTLWPERTTLAETDPALRQALEVVQRPGWDTDYVRFRCQVGYRLALILYPESELGYYVPQPAHFPAWERLLHDRRASYVARLCAAYFLLDTHEDARRFLQAELEHKSTRHRFNAGSVLALHLDRRRAYDEFIPSPWGVEQALAVLANPAFEDGRPMMSGALGSGPDADGGDEMASPVGDLCWLMGCLKEPRAVPVLGALLKRNPWAHAAATALASIGDPRAIPVLLQILEMGGRTSDDVVYALGAFRCRECVPFLIDRLAQGPRSSDSLDFGSRAILVALGRIGDPRAIEPIRAYRAKVTDPSKAADADLILALLEPGDRVPRLLAIYEDANDEFRRSDVLEGLARNWDERVFEKLRTVARTGESRTVRCRAFICLGRSADGVKELVALLDETFPESLNAPPRTKSWSPDINRDLHENIRRILRGATGQDFGEDTRAWQEWVARNPLPARADSR